MIVSRQYLLDIMDEERGGRNALYWVIQPDLVNHSTDPSARKFAVKFITKMLKTPVGVDKAVLSDIYYWSVNLKIDDLLRKVIRASVTLSTSDELLITISGLVNKKFKDISSPQPEWDSW